MRLRWEWRLGLRVVFIIIIRQPFCPVVGRRPQHAVSKLPCLVLSSAISCRSSICLGRLSTAWLVSLVVFSCHMVSKWWHARSIGRLWGGWYALPRTISFFLQCWLFLWLLSSPWPRCWSFYLQVGLSCVAVTASLRDSWVSLTIWSAQRSGGRPLVRPQVYYVLVWSVPRWQHTGVVHLSLQADSKVAFEDVPVFGVCRPACHDSSLYLFVLVIFLEAVVLSQVHVALDIFYQHIVHVYWGVVHNHHICLCDVHLKTHSPTFIG